MTGVGAEPRVLDVWSISSSSSSSMHSVCGWAEEGVWFIEQWAWQVQAYTVCTCIYTGIYVPCSQKFSRDPIFAERQYAKISQAYNRRLGFYSRTSWFASQPRKP